MSLRQQRIDELEGQLDNAIVILEENEPGTYSVYVPGAIREQNYVKAASEHEALDKVRAVLLQKIGEAPEHPTGEVVINPDHVGRRA